MDIQLRISFKEFRQIGREQYIAEDNYFKRLFIRRFGPLGVHARIRNARVINIFQNIRLPKKAYILDAGCGHAYASLWLSRKYPHYHFHAIENDCNLVEKGRLIAKGLGIHNIAFTYQDATALRESEVYDLIFSIDMLEHIENDIEVLNAFRKALKPDGKLVLHLPKRHQEHRRIIPAFRSHTTPEHVRDEYTRDEVQNKLKLSGFKATYLRYGFGLLGEFAFELNYLFWNYSLLRTVFALITHPLSHFLGYLDTRSNYDNGNSILVLAEPLSDLEM